MDIVGLTDPRSAPAGTAGVPSISSLYFAVQVGMTSPSNASQVAVEDKPMQRCVVCDMLTARSLTHFSCPFPNVELGPLLGKGAYGRVYSGMYTQHGSEQPMPVAVKCSDPVQRFESAALTAARCFWSVACQLGSFSITAWRASLQASSTTPTWFDALRLQSLVALAKRRVASGTRTETPVLAVTTAAYSVWTVIRPAC